MEYALVITSIKEKEDGSVSTDPLALATTSMEHFYQFSRIIIIFFSDLLLSAFLNDLQGSRSWRHIKK
jgi:hypothetical protein